MAQFHVTYEIVTEASADDGDCEDCGFVAENISLREAIDLVNATESSHCEQSGIEANDSCISNARWITVYNSADWIEGRAESRSLHIPDNATAASRRRIARLLGVRGA
jgi:hypothetical protein